MNLEELIKGRKDEILVDEIYSFFDSFLENSPIKELKDIKVSGRFFRDIDDLIYIDLNVNGNMLIEDSVSLEDVYYPFSIKIEEKLEEFLTNEENILDIMEFLWQNIVLEIPLRYSSVEDVSKYSGDGWKLINENDKKTNNPFESLLKDKE